jgi:hypothetical protein
MFYASQEEIGYGRIRMLPLMFQDNIMRLVEWWRVWLRQGLDM